MNLTKETIASNIEVHIELTASAIEKFNLAKKTTTENSKLALRISSSSRG